MLGYFGIWQLLNGYLMSRLSKKKPCTLFTTRTNDKLVITEVVNDTITIKEVLDCTLKGLYYF